MKILGGGGQRFDDQNLIHRIRNFDAYSVLSIIIYDQLNFLHMGTMTVDRPLLCKLP